MSKEPSDEYQLSSLDRIDLENPLYALALRRFLDTFEGPDDPRWNLLAEVLSFHKDDVLNAVALNMAKYRPVVANGDVLTVWLFAIHAVKNGGAIPPGTKTIPYQYNRPTPTEEGP